MVIVACFALAEHRQNSNANVIRKQPNPTYPYMLLLSPTMRGVLKEEVLQRMQWCFLDQRCPRSGIETPAVQPRPLKILGNPSEFTTPLFPKEFGTCPPNWEESYVICNT